MRVRRTKEEEAAGFPLELKKDGVDFKDWLAKEKAKEAKEKAAKAEAKAMNTVRTRVLPPIDDPKPAPKVKEEPKKEEDKFIKVIERVIIEGKDSKKTIQDLVKTELDKCVWEWMYVKADSNFKVTDLGKYGKAGWRMAFIHDPTINDSKSKKPMTLCFQRPKRK